ncbi:hypothetical protein KAR91_50195 [Candidatus Pacearchaeota archaeon]|nr:hypothetical protein [Candidatus Pacearchaeota archaeon]
MWQKKKKVCQLAKPESVSRLEAKTALTIVGWDFETAKQYIQNNGKS